MPPTYLQHLQAKISGDAPKRNISIDFLEVTKSIWQVDRNLQALRNSFILWYSALFRSQIDSVARSWKPSAFWISLSPSFKFNS